jgi:hypothetical protein
MDITNNERMRLAASAYRAYIQHAAEMELPLEEHDIEDDILADLIAGLHHYADSRGIGFDSAIASGQAAYERHRAAEDNPYRIGDEVHLRHRPDTEFPSRGVVVSIFPERDGEPTYHVRFPGQADAVPLQGREIGSAASFPAVTTNQGTAASLAAAGAAAHRDRRPDQGLQAAPGAAPRPRSRRQGQPGARDRERMRPRRQ